jgi:ectoine hydroxylase-related dioxygenase (phytanoyl-CoA dioxygenase family)
LAERVIGDQFDALSNFLETSGILLNNVWIQQYEKGDSHGWHTHENCNFSNVYYIDLNGECPKTHFKFRGFEFEIPVKEGQILTFPGYIAHCSKENKSDYVKSVLAFNSSFCGK